MNKLKKLTTALLFSTVALSSFATELNFNIYQLSVSTEAQVKNDIMKATLVASHLAKSSADASRVVNQKMAAALQQLKATSGIEYETGTYQTHPTYQREKMSGWQASQQLMLKSTDVEKLTQLIGKLQQELKLSGMSFEVSKPIEQKMQNKLSISALNKFKRKAELIKRVMGADSYKIVSVNLNSGMRFRPMAQSMQRAEMAVMSYDMPTPAVKSGNSLINANASGKIQLIFD